MNIRKHWPTMVFFGGGLLIAAYLLIHASISEPKRTEYFYMAKGPVFHLDPKCSHGLVYIKAEQVYSETYPDWCFCSRCITPEELGIIRDSISARHSSVTLP